MANILDLYQQDCTDKLIGVNGGREYRGPCPVCGGTDRFGVWPRQNDGNGSFFCGRMKGGGIGCGIGGDCIQYLVDVRKMTYREACDYLGIEAKGSGQSTRYRRRLPEPVRDRTEVFVPDEKQFPEEVENPAIWVAKGTEFVDKCHEALLARPTSIAYLMARGITMEGIQKYKLGFFAGEERKGKPYEPAFRPRKSWGLTETKNAKGRPAMVIIPAGIVVPYFAHGGTLHRITIRLIKPDKQNPRKKYHYLKGSVRDLFVTGRQARAYMTIEAELDCIAVDCAAGDIIGTVGIGSSGVRPDASADGLLRESACILGGHDFDTAGAAGGEFWKTTYEQYRRWPVPVGKDPGEAFEAGVDLRAWVLAGLPDFLHPEDGRQRTEERNHETEKGNSETEGGNHETKTATQESQERDELCQDAAPVGRPEEEKACASFGNDLAELKGLLKESRGVIRVFNGGIDVAKELPRSWSLENFKKSGRISELLNLSPVIGEFVEMVGDGIYDYTRIPERI